MFRNCHYIRKRFRVFHFLMGYPSMNTNSMIISIWLVQHASCSVFFFFSNTWISEKSFKYIWVHFLLSLGYSLRPESLFPPQTVILKNTYSFPGTQLGFPCILGLTQSLPQAVCCGTSHDENMSCWVSGRIDMKAILNSWKLSFRE